MSHPTGWIDFPDRDAATNRAHEAALAGMSEFKISGSAPGDRPSKIVLTDFWKDARVVKSLGYAFPRIHQITGCCVGAGGGNALFTLSAIEVIRLGDPEQILVPFWLLPYGISRKLCGMRGPGEGSAGSTFAQAVKEYGVIPANLDGLPGFQNSDGLVWGGQAERQWSDGDRIGQEWLDQARKHLVKSTSPCAKADDVREAIQNYYPCTDACSGFVQSPRMRGDTLVGQIDSNGGHQTSIQGWQEHPQLGELFLYQNNWPESAYPTNPDGAACSCWITKQSMQRICDEGEVYAFSQFDGFPAQNLHHLI